MRTPERRNRRFLAGFLAAALAISVSPLVGAGVAQAETTPLPPVANPIGEGNFCEGAPSTNPFTDVTAADPGLEHILCLLATGLTTGTTATTYTPNGPLTRRQMALFIERLIDLVNELELVDLQELPASDGTSGFSDVGAGDPGLSAISRLRQAGIVGGFPDGSYRPNEPLSRRQMAAFINRTQEFISGEAFEAPDGADYFPDDDGDTGEDNLNALASVGIFQGDANGNVNPGQNLTRRQMAFILLRHLQVNYDAGAIDRPDFDEVPGSNQAFSVSPTGPALNTVSTTTGEHENRGSRTYTVTGITTPSVDIALIPSANVTDTNGRITFRDEDTNVNRADGLGSPLAVIETVNGVPAPGGPSAYVNNVAVTGGTVTFTVDSTVVFPPQVIIPVVFHDADNNNQLNLNADGTPSEPFGIGGLKLWIPEDATFGAYTNIESVLDLADLVNLFTGKQGGAAPVGPDSPNAPDFTFRIKDNDQFRYQPLTTAPFLSRSEFNAHLNGVSTPTRNLQGGGGAAPLNPASPVTSARWGDRLDIGYANEAPSVFTITQDAPNAPTNVTVTAVDADTDGSVDDNLVTWTAPANLRVDGYSVYRRTSTNNGPFGNWTGVGVVKGKSNTQFNDLNRAPATGTSVDEYLVVAYNVTSDPAFAQVAPNYNPQLLPNPSPLDRHSPDSNVARIELGAVADANTPYSMTSTFTNGANVGNNPAIFDAGDSFSFTFNGPITIGANATIDLLDNDGTSARLTNGGNATMVVSGGNNNILTVTLTGLPTLLQLGPAPATNTILTGTPTSVLASSGIGNVNGDWNLPESGRRIAGAVAADERTRVVDTATFGTRNAVLVQRPLNNSTVAGDSDDRIISNDNSFEAQDANPPGLYVNVAADTLRIKPGADNLANGERFFVYNALGQQVASGTYNSGAGNTVNLTGGVDYGDMLYLVRRAPDTTVPNHPSRTTRIRVAPDRPEVPVNGATLLQPAANGNGRVAIQWIDNDLSPVEPVGITQVGPASNYQLYDAANNVLVRTGELVQGSPTGPGSPGVLTVQFNGPVAPGNYTLRVAPNTVQDPNNLPNEQQVRAITLNQPPPPTAPVIQSARVVPGAPGAVVVAYDQQVTCQNNAATRAAFTYTDGNDDTPDSSGAPGTISQFSASECALSGFPNPPLTNADYGTLVYNQPAPPAGIQGMQGLYAGPSGVVTVDDVTAPEMTAIAPAAAPTNTVTITMSEVIRCADLGTEDFRVSVDGGQRNVTGVANCAAPRDDVFDITFDGAPTVAGAVVTVESLPAGTLRDRYGNNQLARTLQATVA